MGKGDLWDDSALLNAFDKAMSKFKDMHNIDGRHEVNSTDLGDANGKPQVFGEYSENGVSDETERCVEGLDKGSNHSLLIASKSEDPESLTSAAEQKTFNVQAYGEHMQGSCSIETLDGDHYLPESLGNGDYLPESQDNGTYLPESQGLDDYYLLCKEHLELEEKRLQLWYRFQQYHSNWNYQYPGGSFQTYAPYGCGGSNSQHLTSSDPGLHPTGAVSCCPYACPISTAPNSSVPSCSSCGPCCLVPCTSTEVGKSNGGTEVGNRAGGAESGNSARGTEGGNSAGGPEGGNSAGGTEGGNSAGGTEGGNSARDPPAAITDSDFVRKGMEAAEKVLAVLKMKSSGELGVEIGNCSSSSNDTTTSGDLSDVLKAWYTAGLYTGKYLAEQSSISKQDL